MTRLRADRPRTVTKEQNRLHQQARRSRLKEVAVEKGKRLDLALEDLPIGSINYSCHQLTVSWAQGSLVIANGCSRHGPWFLNHEGLGMPDSPDGNDKLEDRLKLHAIIEEFGMHDLIESFRRRNSLGGFRSQVLNCFAEDSMILWQSELRAHPKDQSGSASPSRLSKKEIRAEIKQVDRVMHCFLEMLNDKRTVIKFFFKAVDENLKKVFGKSRKIMFSLLSVNIRRTS
eukprot:Lithocolla_globosa_v1_NODE_6520_length_1074_cov_5.257115.p1 type:complete len:230 gc:universal NODE_6520_length_1074_cov_5.257115:754-65(-)